MHVSEPVPLEQTTFLPAAFKEVPAFTVAPAIEFAG
jgi:hypothetical protein